MKINEILSESRVDELGTTPMGIGSRIGQKLASFVPGQVGVKAAATLDVGKRANELSSTFTQWALRSGVTLNNVPVKSIKEFLRQQNLPQPKFSQTVYNLSDQAQNKKVWDAVAQAAYRAGGTTQTAPLGQQYGVGQGQQSASQAGGAQSINSLITSLGSMAGSMTPNQLARLQNILRGSGTP